MYDRSNNLISEVVALSDSNVKLPKGTSFFDTYLNYYVREIIQVGGEAVVSLDSYENQTGLYIYDPIERSGTVFTSAREVFDFFFKYRPHLKLFSEMENMSKRELYNIYSIDLPSQYLDHDFRYEIRVVEEDELDRIEQFMFSVDPKMNRKWVRVAFGNGDVCFSVEIDHMIAGLGWLSLIRNMGRVHTLFVLPRFRRGGIGTDLLAARLMWLRAKGATGAFSEISEFNIPSAAIALRAGMKQVGVIYQYLKSVE